MKIKIINSLIIICLLVSIKVKDSQAVCSGVFHNPLTEVNWYDIFPVTIAGIKIPGPSTEGLLPNVESPICNCGPLLWGITVTFWEPARAIDVVKDPYCFPMIGTGFSNPATGFLGGSNKIMGSGDKRTTSTFHQTHYYVYPIWKVLGMFLDMICLKNESFGMVYISEIDATHNNDMFALFLNPEALLFANPVAQMACVADSVASTMGFPLSPLFWCAGGWGSIYPLAGKTGKANIVEASALQAARTIFKMGRLLMLFDPGVYYCGSYPTPIWIKSHYKMHLAKPVRDPITHPVGRTSITWDWFKNPPFAGAGNASDNFLWIIFRYVRCCLYII